LLPTNVYQCSDIVAGNAVKENLIAEQLIHEVLNMFGRFVLSLVLKTGDLEMSETRGRVEGKQLCEASDSHVASTCNCIATE